MKVGLQACEVTMVHLKDIKGLVLSAGVRKGQRLGIVGNSGCGKSKLLNVILGFYPASTGQFITTRSP